MIGLAQNREPVPVSGTRSSGRCASEVRRMCRYLPLLFAVAELIHLHFMSDCRRLQDLKFMTNRYRGAIRRFGLKMKLELFGSPRRS